MLRKKMTVRWCLQRDIDACSHIEKSSLENPWGREDFEICLRSRNSNGMVLEISDRVVGHIMYCMRSRRITVVGLTVSPEHRRLGVGTKLISTLLRKISVPDSINETIDCTASERNTGMHHFLKSNGFKAVEVRRHHFGPEHDGYKFVRLSSAYREKMLKKGVYLA